MLVEGDDMRRILQQRCEDLSVTEAGLSAAGLGLKRAGVTTLPHLEIMQLRSHIELNGSKESRRNSSELFAYYSHCA